MDSKTWVCTFCSQDFTRKYSAYRHSRDLHHGQGKIVRMIDYVIGRISGEYNPGNPSTYRSRYKQQDSAFTRSDAKAFTFPFASIAHDTSQGNFSKSSPYNKDYVPNQQQPNTDSVQSSTSPISGFSSKINEIEKLSRTLLPPQTAEELLRKLPLKVIDNDGSEDILDHCLQELRNKKNIMEASRYLFGAPTKEEKRPPLHRHHVEHLPESSRIKLAEIEKMLTINLKNDNAVFERIKYLIGVCNSTTNHIILDLELDSLKSNRQEQDHEIDLKDEAPGLR